MRKLLSFLSTLLPFTAKAELSVTGIASYYAKHYEGKLMANGETYHAAIWTVATNDKRFKLGDQVRVEYTTPKGSYRYAIATVTDRGPAVQFKKAERYFDLSYGLFKHLENPRFGVIRVTVSVVNG